MIRSMSFIHLFIILAVSYIGGALLFRTMPIPAVERIILYYDSRIVQGHEASYIGPVAMTFAFFVLAFAMAYSKKIRFIVPLLGAIRTVLFGVSSAYLLSTSSNMLTYSIWWFPFQLVSCFLFLVYCAVLSPPYFTRQTMEKRRNLRAIPMLIVLSAGVLLLEMLLFYIILR